MSTEHPRVRLYAGLDGLWHALGDRMDDGLTYLLCGSAIYRSRLAAEATQPTLVVGTCIPCSAAVVAIYKAAA